MFHKEKRHLLSWIDVLLLIFFALLILAVALFLLYRFQRKEDKTINIRYTVWVSEVNEGLLEAWARSEEGTPVRNSNGTAFLGTVKSVTYEQSQKAMIRDGEPIMNVIPHAYDVTLEVWAQALDMGAEGLRVHDIRIAAGCYYDLLVGGIRAKNARILDVKTEDEL